MMVFDQMRQDQISKNYTALEEAQLELEIDEQTNDAYADSFTKRKPRIKGDNDQINQKRCREAILQF